MAATARTRYDSVAMWLHWLIAFLIIFMLVFGEDLMNRRHPDTFNASVHASIGATILILSLIRLLWRMRKPSPPLPETMRLWEIALAKVTHVIFYVMMIGLPISGWLAFSDTVVKHPGFVGTSFFGLLQVVQIPSAVGLPFDGIHSLGSNFMIALISLHVLAALKHQFIDKDHLLRRMVPLKLRDNSQAICQPDSGISSASAWAVISVAARWRKSPTRSLGQFHPGAVFSWPRHNRR